MPHVVLQGPGCLRRLRSLRQSAPSSAFHRRAGRERRARVRPCGEAVRPGTGAETVLLDEAKKVLVEMEQLADEVPNKAHAHLLKGSSPADLLLKCAQDEGCDLIVMGSRGQAASRLPWQRQLRRGAGIAYRRAHREGRSRRSDESRGDRLACLQLHEKSSGREISYSNRRELPDHGELLRLMVVVADYAMKTYDAPAATAGLAASIFVIGALIARLFSGRIMDRVGRKRLLIIGAVLEVAFSALYLTGLGLWLLFALRLLHGIAFGTCSTAIGTIVTALVPDNRKGEGVGYYMLSVTLGAAIGPFLGMFLTQNAGFQTLFLVAAAVALACLLAATQLRVPKTLYRPKPWPGRRATSPATNASSRRAGSACLVRA